MAKALRVPKGLLLWTLAVICGAVQLSVAADVSQMDPVKRAFLNDYEPAVGKIVDAYTHLRMTITETRTPNEPAAAPIVVVRQYLSNGQLLSSRRNIKKSEGESIDATIARPDLTFHVKKRSSSSEAYVADEIQSESYLAFVQRLRLGAKLPFAPYCFFEDTILSFLSEEDVSITSIEDVTEGGAHKKRVGFRAPYNPAGAAKFVLIGTFVFAPDDGWVLLEYHRTTEGADAPWLHCQIAYGDFKTEGGIPIAEKVEYWRTDGDQASQLDVFVATDIDMTAAGASEFTLAAYGIPDVVPTGRGPVLYVLLFVNALIVILVVLWSRRRNRPTG